MTVLPDPHGVPRDELRNSAGVSISDRESLAMLIRSFLASEITAFAFDEQLDRFRDSTDPIVQYVADAVWYYYDDGDDHLVCLTKHEWNFFQRLLLVLAADCRVEIKTTRYWSIKQPVAAISLAAFVYFGTQSGPELDQLLLLSIPFGMASMVLSFWPIRYETIRDPYARLITPFASFSDLATAYYSSGFQKVRYPKQIGDRRIRSRFSETFEQLQWCFVWLAFSPIALLFQMFPDAETEARVSAGIS